LPPSVSQLSRQCGILNILQPSRPPWPVTGIAFLAFMVIHPSQAHNKQKRLNHQSISIGNCFKNSGRECKSFVLVSTLISLINSSSVNSKLTYFTSKCPFFVLFSWYFFQKLHIIIFCIRELILTYIIKFKSSSKQKPMAFLNGISLRQHRNYRESYNKTQKKNRFHTEIIKSVIGI
jgi:hypothetical protein